ncbi:hypothetical protein JL720_16578 [Aureococcus anophagefferens]|nr:hypothetical protein JL720_16578 [Aureococcus anophagefferens]
MADSPKQRASSIAEEPQQDDALASDDDDGAPAAKPHPPVGGSQAAPAGHGQPEAAGRDAAAREVQDLRHERGGVPAGVGRPGARPPIRGRRALLRSKTAARHGLASHVEVENSVEAFWRLCALHPRLIDEAEAAHEESLKAEERGDAAAQRIRPRPRPRWPSVPHARAVVVRVLRDDDRDKNEALDHDEYERFYARLVHLVDPDDEMTELEIAEAMEDDFKSDSEGHAQVTKDEFVASVFELADNWTNSTDADEYVEFLKLGYDRCRTRFNCKNERDVRKRVKALALALEHANAEDAHNDWLWLFSRMVGCYRISGRIKSIPPPGVDFVCKAFDEIEGMLKDSKRSLPSKLKCDEEKLAGTQSPRVGFCVGFIGVAPLKKWLAANVFRPLRISENDEPQLLHAILRVLEKMARSLESEARAQSITNADVNNFKVKDLVTCVEVMVLISNVWCAMHYDEFENRQKEKREQGREGGAALARVRRSRKKR